MAKKVNIKFPNPKDLGIEVHLTGEWEKATNVIQNLAPTIQKGYDKAIEAFSKKLLRIVRTAMITGTPPTGSNVYWQELSTYTIERWGEHPIYNMTGLYARSIGLFKYRSKTYVGLPQNKRRSSVGGLTLNQLAILLEYGSRSSGIEEGGGNGSRIPPRPLWAPSLEAAGGMGTLRKTLLTSLRSQIRTDLGISPNQIR